MTLLRLQTTKVFLLPRAFGSYILRLAVFGLFNIRNVFCYSSSKLKPIRTSLSNENWIETTEVTKIFALEIYRQSMSKYEDEERTKGLRHKKYVCVGSTPEGNDNKIYAYINLNY